MSLQPHQQSPMIISELEPIHVPSGVEIIDNPGADTAPEAARQFFYATEQCA
ncbi:hypothetical protein KA529_00575 [Candidatus Saccharibacteria bacterium]|nr:hypothetical protein [Candidatus Saccharibacteria bacterium]